MHKHLLRPERVRRIPNQFSWIDHRLVREGHIERCPAEACALYLFLVTVADARGLSYYSDAAIARRLSMDEPRLHKARAALLGADLLAYEPPLYQVLSMPQPSLPESARRARPRALSELLRNLGPDR